MLGKETLPLSAKTLWLHLISDRYRYLVNTHCVPRAVLGTRNTVVNKAGEAPALMVLTFMGECQGGVGADRQ